MFWYQNTSGIHHEEPHTDMAQRIVPNLAMAGITHGMGDAFLTPCTPPGCFWKHQESNAEVGWERPKMFP